MTSDRKTRIFCLFAGLGSVAAGMLLALALFHLVAPEAHGSLPAYEALSVAATV